MGAAFPNDGRRFPDRARLASVRRPSANGEEMKEQTGVFYDVVDETLRVLETLRV